MVSVAVKHPNGAIAGATFANVHPPKSVCHHEWLQPQKHQYQWCEHSDIEGATTNVKHQDVLLATLVVETVRDGSSLMIHMTFKDEIVLGCCRLDSWQHRQ